MSYVIRLATEDERTSRADVADAVALAQRMLQGKPPGKYLEWSDPDADGGNGAERWTGDVSKAMRFDTFEAAHACWTAQSKKFPTRPDGRPNRPMTAYSVAIERKEDA